MKKKIQKKILSPDEPLPFKVENARGQGNGLIICDHASNRVPLSLKNMGLKKADLQKHIGWDIGVYEISRHLAKKLDMPAVLASYTRLAVDLNRAPRYRECMIEESDHIKIPANAKLTAAARAQRLKELYWPYHDAVGKQVDHAVSKKRVPLLLAVHSLTPVMDDIKRPWHISILWHREDKIAKKITTTLRKNNPGILVGENEPYTLFDERFAGSTMDRHAEARNLPYVFVEFRQDLVDTKEKAVHWADIFAEALQPVLETTAFFVGRKVGKYKR